MTTTLEPAIKADWDHFFDIAHTEEDWITPLLNSLDGVDAREAFWRPGGTVASIADIVLHANGWLEQALRAVFGMPETDNEDWPVTPESSESNWTQMVENLRVTIADLSRALHNLSLEELYNPAGGRKLRRSTILTNILVHSAYHAGQIVKLRQAHLATEGALA